MLFLEHVAEISERIERTGIGLKDALSIIDLTFEDQIAQTGTASPYEAFEGLNELIDLTVHGSKTERFRPRKDRQPFHTSGYSTLTRHSPCGGMVIPDFERSRISNKADNSSGFSFPFPASISVPTILRTIW